MSYYKTDIVSVLNGIKTQYGIASVYSHFTDGHALPYLVYIGAGQVNFAAGNSTYWRENQYQVQLYFKAKDYTLENNIEEAFIQGGYQFDKTEDIYLNDEGIYYITYNLY